MQSISKNGWLLSFKQLSTYIVLKRSKLLSTRYKHNLYTEISWKWWVVFFLIIFYLKTSGWLQAQQPALHMNAKSIVLVLNISPPNLNPFSAIPISLRFLLHSEKPVELCPTSLPCQVGIYFPAEHQLAEPAGPTQEPSLSKHGSHMSRKSEVRATLWRALTSSAFWELLSSMKCRETSCISNCLQPHDQGLQFTSQTNFSHQYLSTFYRIWWWFTAVNYKDQFHITQKWPEFFTSPLSCDCTTNTEALFRVWRTQIGIYASFAFTYIPHLHMILKAKFSCASQSEYSW